MPVISEIACPETSTRTRLLEKMVTTSDLVDSIGNRRAQCSVELSSVINLRRVCWCVMTQKSCSAFHGKRERDKKRTMHP